MPASDDELTSTASAAPPAASAAPPAASAAPPAASAAPPAAERRHTALDEFAHGVEEARLQFDQTNEAINRRVGRNLLAAIGIGLLLGGVFVASLVFADWLFMFVAAALIGLTVFELSSALRLAGRDVPRVASTVGGVATVPVAFFVGVDGLWLAVLAAIALTTLWRLVEWVRPSHRRGARQLALDVGAGAFVQLYVTFLAGLYVALVGLPDGEWWTLAAIVVVVVTDIAAYATGLAFGRHKLAPSISPGKTWEGFAGSVLAAAVAGVLFGWLMLGQPLWVGLVMGVLLALVGTMGDLTESLIKRDLGVKDISSWLPGHGGFLDRLDSILPAAAVAYAVHLVATGSA